jgi:hypothetical protein
MKVEHPKAIRFKFSPEKARTALHWMLSHHGLTLHTALKACYFADKMHLNAHGRPVFGATYRAMKFGPVPLEIYEMAKGDPIWLAELEADRYPWRLDGYTLSVQENGNPNLDVLSESDLEAVKAGFLKSTSMTFSERTAVTHGHDWQSAHLGIMRYEDMIDETPEKPHLVAYLREAGPLIRL